MVAFTRLAPNSVMPEEVVFTFAAGQTNGVVFAQTFACDSITRQIPITRLADGADKITRMRTVYKKTYNLI